MLSNMNDMSKDIKVNLDSVRRVFVECFKNGKSNEVNINLLTKLIIIAGDLQIKDIESVKTFIIDSNSNINDREYRNSLKVRTDCLRKQVGKLINFPKPYSLEHILKMKEWCFLLKGYLTNDKLIGQANSIMGKTVIVKNLELKNKIKSLEKKMNNYNERLEIDMNQVNLKEAESVLVAPQEYILDMILEEAREKGLEEEIVDNQAIYEEFPELSLVKREPVVLSFEYDTDEYVLAVLLVVVNKATISGFDTCTVGLIDWDKEAEEYITTFKDIPEIALAKNIQDLINEKEITYIDPKTTEKLLNVII